MFPETLENTGFRDENKKVVTKCEKAIDFSGGGVVKCAEGKTRTLYESEVTYEKKDCIIAYGSVFVYRYDAGECADGCGWR